MGKEGTQGKFGVDVNVLYCYCSGGNMSISICQNSYNCTQRMGAFYYINYTSVKLVFKKNFLSS